MSHQGSPKNTGCHSLLQGIFLTQGLNPGLRHWRQILYHRATREAQYITSQVECPENSSFLPLSAMPSFS